MVARDKKAHLATEALQAARHIKFSATESEWEEKILAPRLEELSEQWRVYVMGVYLTFCWFSMPVCLSAVALITFVCFGGNLTPAVGFTALSVFTRLEFSLSVVPNVISQLQESRVSIRRIREYLEVPEPSDTRVPSAQVRFVNATVSWPSKLPGAWGYRLQNLDLSFPEGELR